MPESTTDQAITDVATKHSGRPTGWPDTWRSVAKRAEPAISWLPLAGLTPSFLLATWSLTQPWAEGRAMLVWGISRSPGATVLVVMTLVAMLGASVAVATRGRRHLAAAFVHLATGALMLGVAALAYHMVRDARVTFLGLIPLASIHPGPGLRAFVAAASLVFALGLVEAFLGMRARR